MVAVVGRMPIEVEAGQLRLWIPSIGMINPATPHMGRRLHKLVDAQVDEHSGEEVSGLLVKAHIDVASDDGRPSHVDHLLQVVIDVLQAGSFRPDKISHDEICEELCEIFQSSSEK